VSDDPVFSERGDKTEIELGTAFSPAFDSNGLIPCITTDAATGDVLMFAWMNADALAETIRTGTTCYWSRSRKKLWRKGETSGSTQSVVEIRTDCDQDVILLRVRVAGTGSSCHQGYRSCFYRRVKSDEAGQIVLEFTEERVAGSGDLNGK
jgi:phosphoribosyl-AMP cyclohydrolase